MTINIALLGTYATQFFTKILNKNGIKRGINLNFYEGNYNAIDLEIINPMSPLYDLNPEFIVIHESDLSLRDSFYNTSSNRDLFAENKIEKIKFYTEIIRQKLPKAKILYPIISNQNDGVFGNYFSKVKQSFTYQITKYNWLLMEFANECDNLILIESPSQDLICKRDWTQVVNADLHFTIDFLDQLAKKIIYHIQASKGQFTKCLILDLDNTLWGGIIGDDGIEGIQIGSIGIGKAFYRLQKWIKELNRRGIILAVCSKNNPEVAKLPFEKHSEMVIKLDDIAVFVANWSSKADNINYIQKILNIGFDSMVFIDDNPAEREIVRQHIPQVIVPDLPEDPALYLDYLISLNLFDTASYSLNDSIRTKQYQEEAKRKELATSITNFDDYLKSLDMVATVTNFEPSEFERIAQLTQRSNQFNLRTIRYNINDIKKIANSPYNLKYAVSLKDKFGDYGLISVVIIDIDEQDYTAKIDTWLMSCRVLKRGVEFFIHNKIMEELLKKGIKILNGEFIPTSKNNLVSNLLTELGFNKTKNENFYSIEISKFIEHKTFIKN